MDADLFASLAFLARLDLEPDEGLRLEGQVARILAYVDRLAEIPMTGEPTDNGPEPRRAADEPLPASVAVRACLPDERVEGVPLPRVVG